MKKLRRARKPVGPQWLCWCLFTGGALCMGLAVAVAVLWINFESLAAVWEWTVKYPTYLTLTALLYTAVIYLLGALLGRLWISGLLVGAAALVMALVDYFKTTINGTPLTLVDFGLATKIGEVAGMAGELTPPVDFWRALAAIAFCAMVLLLVRRLTGLSGQVRFLSGSLALIALMFLFSSDGAKQVGEAFEVDVYTRMPAASNNHFYGLTLALWRDAVRQDAEAPSGYDQAYMEQVLSRIDELLAKEQAETDAENAVAQKNPNIIFILSEAFFDLTRMPELQYERDPLVNFHALAEEGISGTFQSHYLGYGTGYIEMAMQYGITNLDFDANTNICFLEDTAYEYFDALPEQYTNHGDYRAEMFHAYDNSLYNRTVTYPLLGYDRLSFSADIQQMGIDWSGSVYGGYYLKDAYMYEGMLRRMQEINEDGQRAFLCGITMENHQPFDPEKFDYACQVGVKSETLGDADMAIVRVMLEGITRADQALGALADALRVSDEPTIVVFYGDHRPNLFMTDGDTVYTKLGQCPENETINWTAEQAAELYSTDYLIWANDAALLNGAAGTKRHSSITALGPQLLEITGEPLSRYWGLQTLVSREVLTQTELYTVTGDGMAYSTLEDANLSPEAQELLELRSAVIYDAFFGEQYITEAMNCPAETN